MEDALLGTWANDDRQGTADRNLTLTLLPDHRFTRAYGTPQETSPTVDVGTYRLALERRELTLVTEGAEDDPETYHYRIEGRTLELRGADWPLERFTRTG